MPTSFIIDIITLHASWHHAAHQEMTSKPARHNNIWPQAKRLKGKAMRLVLTANMVDKWTGHDQSNFKWGTIRVINVLSNLLFMVNMCKHTCHTQPPNSGSGLINVPARDRKRDQIFLCCQAGLCEGMFPRRTPLLFHTDVGPLRTQCVVFFLVFKTPKEIGKE